jgi:hypothetical protein
MRADRRIRNDTVRRAATGLFVEIFGAQAKQQDLIEARAVSHNAGPRIHGIGRYRRFAQPQILRRDHLPDLPAGREHKAIACLGSHQFGIVGLGDGNIDRSHSHQGQSQTHA